MTRLLRKLSIARDDDGSALVVALVVVLAVGIMMTAVLDFAGTSISSGIQIRDLRNTNYYAQGAVDGAINQVRGSSKTTCSDYTPPPPPTSIKGATGHAYKVTCAMTSSSNAGIQQPDYAVLTLSTASNEGFIATGNHSLQIDGGVYSRNEVSMQHKTMTVNGSLYADGACSPTSPADGGGNVTTTDIATMKCKANGSTDPDPKYKAVAETTNELNTMLASYGADPTPTCANGVVTFTPGLYTQLPGVLVDNYAASSCGSAHVWWFKPGPYFFDFSGTWNIGNPCPGSLPCAYDVVGGEPTAPAPAATDPLGYTDWVHGVGTPEADWNHIDPATETNYPACRDDVTTDSYDGVQFEFGGASKVKVGSQGGIELCGPTNASDQTSIVRSQSDGSTQHIVLDALRVGSTVDPDVTGANFTAVHAPAATGTWTMIPDASVAQQPDGSLATAAIVGNNTASLTYTGPYRQTSPPNDAFPQGVDLSSAAVRVYWKKVTGSPTVKLLFTPAHSGAATQSTTISSCALKTDSNFPSAEKYCDVSVPMNTLSDPNWKDLTEGTIALQASGNGTTVGVDAVALVVAYTPVNADKNTCTLATNCLFWDSHVNLNVHLHGTTYVPANEMDVEVQGSGSTIFDRGVIAATLHANINASSTQTRSPFELPAATPNGRTALFTGYVDSDIRVRACVKFQDFDLLPDGKTKQAFPGYKVQVQSWNVFHGSPTGTPTC